MNPLNAVAENGRPDAIGTGCEKPFLFVFLWVCVDFRKKWRTLVTFICGLNALVSVLQCTASATRLISTNVFRGFFAFLCACCVQGAKRDGRTARNEFGVELCRFKTGMPTWLGHAEKYGKMISWLLINLMCYECRTQSQRNHVALIGMQ